MKSDYPDPLLNALETVGRLYHRPVNRESAAAGLPLEDGWLTPKLFVRAAERCGLDASIVKCRPDKDRDPTPQEIRTCLTYLARQIAAVNPTVICTMGPLAARVLTGNHQSLFRFRGRFHDFHGIPLMPTFHPRFLLKNEAMKKASWTDLQTIQKKLSATSKGENK